MAAGALIIQEAGGMATDFSGDQTYLENGNIVAGNPKIHAEMLRRIQPYLTPELQKSGALNL
jgi:myo-inositol-1(or 4)-monophosphatase